jgi:hypothetical protein
MALTPENSSQPIKPCAGGLGEALIPSVGDWGDWGEAPQTGFFSRTTIFPSSQ